MKKYIIGSILLLFTAGVFGQYDENREKFTLLGGFISSGSEFVFWSDNVYGGNLQLVYDILKIGEGSIGLKASGAWAEGFGGYYGGASFRIGSRLFGDLDLLVGHSSISNEKLLSGYPGVNKYSGGAFAGNLGFGYRFPNNPFVVRLALTTHFPFKDVGINYGYNFQIGYRF